MFFTESKVEANFFVESVPAQNRGKAISVKDAFPGLVNSGAFIGDAKVHDANFAFLTTTLAKVHTKLIEPKWYVTYAKDIDLDIGGGFVDYVSMYEVNWAGIMNEFRNIMGNNANYIPRVNAGLTQKKVNVYTFEVAYDLRFVELEKMKKLDISKSIQDIYNNAIVAGFDLFAQKVGYVGIQGKTGLFNSDDKVLVTTIDNSAASAANSGFKGMTDEAVVSFFNGLIAFYLKGSNMNLSILPDRILVPTFVGSDLSGRMSALYTASLRNYILKNNLAVDESEADFKLSILSRPDLDTLGTGGHGRIVAYRKDKDFVRMDMPYQMQHYITLPNIERMAYTSAFVAQISEIELPYNTSDEELGIVTYWDFTK
jgi:hypothetical protein